MENSIASLHAADSEEIKPYKIHVSSKYLDLTKKKLELTRLPHEVLLPRGREGEHGTPKSEIEPLIDFWLEHYTWRQRETHLNTALPQYRTAISLPSTTTTPTPSPPLRIHFLHIKSPHKHALPLLLIPTFPLTNLSLTPLFAPLTDPASPTSTQPFTLIVPSLPGLGFSDAFQTSTSLLSKSAALCDALMKRLGYTYYLASATGSGADSPAGIDYHLLRILGEEHKDRCLGIHVIEPCVQAPILSEQPVGWMKFAFARFFHANLWGYEKSDFVALASTQSRTRTRTSSHPNNARGEERPLLNRGGRAYGAVGVLGLREPNTFAYALCDSPVGLLSLVLSALRRRSPGHGLSKMEIIDVTQLAWLPGPEAGARFWAAAVDEVRGFESGMSGPVDGRKGKEKKKMRERSKVAVTVFGADGEGEAYVCPAWAGTKHNVLFSQRASGRAGIAVWERVDVLVDGIRGLAREVERVDPRLRIRALEEIVVFQEPVLEGTEDESESRGRESVDYSIDESWVGGDGEDGEEHGEHGMQLDVESPDTVVAVNLRG
ncbi:Alpha/Beta hydrolase protein [Rhexocercosporidium sp. MPI-PUGE-AT-0058]|nr:Alpha/Beta hydrolase protein [Rhexocercosporidium sp. MPI-PUGE-AT-0058]